MPRDNQLIALWRKIAASSRASSKQRLLAIDRLAATDGLYYLSVEAARSSSAMKVPRLARLLLLRLLKRLAKDDRTSARVRAAAVDRLAFIAGHQVAGLFRGGHKEPIPAQPDLSTVAGIRAAVDEVVGGNGVRTNE